MQVGVHSEPQQWAEKQFAGAKLTDVRRVARVKKIAETMAVHPGRSIPLSYVAARMPSKPHTIFSNTKKPPPTIFKRGIGPSFCKRCASLGCISY